MDRLVQIIKRKYIVLIMFQIHFEASDCIEFEVINIVFTTYCVNRYVVSNCVSRNS